MSRLPGYRLERDAQITEALAAGPMSATGITRKILGIAAGEKPPRSLVARVTQSLRVMEQEGIVVRSRVSGRILDWRLSAMSDRLYALWRNRHGQCHWDGPFPSVERARGHLEMIIDTSGGTLITREIPMTSGEQLDALPIIERMAPS